MSNNKQFVVTVSKLLPVVGTTWTTFRTEDHYLGYDDIRGDMYAKLPWKFVAYGNGIFVLITDYEGDSWSEHYVSSNGTSWTFRNTWLNATTRQSVCFGKGGSVPNGLFVMTCKYSSGAKNLTSANDNWTLNTITVATTSGGNYTNPNWSYSKPSCYGNGLFVAIYNDIIFRTSLNGVAWAERTVPTGDWRAICWSEEKKLFVAVSYDGKIITSPNGTTWTSRTSPANNRWVSVCYGGGLFVVVSSNGTNRVMTSPDGITWTLRASADDSKGWTAICYGNNTFLAVASGAAMGSSDGINWSMRNVGFTGAMYSICYSPELNKFVAGGNGFIATTS